MKLTKVAEKEAHDDGIWTCCWVPGTNSLLTGSVDESVKRWRVQSAGDSQEVIEEYKHDGHTLGCMSLDVSDHGYAASSSLDSMIRVWDVEDKTRSIAIFESAPTETWAVAFGPSTEEGRHIATAGGTRNSVVIWKLGKTEIASELQVPPSTESRVSSRKEYFVMSTTYSPNYKFVASGSMDGTVSLWDVQSGSFYGKCEGHFKPVRSIKFTPDSKFLLTACDDMQVHLYDVATLTLVESFSGHESWALSVAPHPTAETFATSGADGHVRLWSLRTRSCVQTLDNAHADQAWSLAWNSEGSQLASVGDDKKLNIYSFSG
uniref:Anaphase-promoting complex subunit 4 WD40 domain-containing protein n=1 Tax=Polytomella parva TaxID=51329 RepID=A0A7S0YU27_9CHLO|mmetsp:Transcript_9713/g.18150  ORF Transcript_9713/g.18150 Transcript_9713/m.18150 type:complete len:319 (+) Transcript_9713:72-1028(+)|eukprot:CAMPEP_0175053396 /NCGR_PEP_ID=MMETSP0052_2-20121109/8900_1 /TAXON_ID=51329 ORGANISM="Polytomella parva, Strain SAG 63-3" /NCGR_SAMPLE_ID=MMETSP0052_2 /ASSEMBLY_ACC=CAM_ASM_000194 /LENGTH=318 /DNA_ID=CAMNT_0016317923 /DNA_START=7 /DNA_END=963 /DNA_ORIENTATION=-